MINQVDLMAVVEKHRDNGVVVPTMTGSRGWNEVSSNKDRDIPLGGAMGKASSFALGVALAQPDLKVFVFDGDGSLLMNLGTLVTVAEKAPQELLPLRAGERRLRSSPVVSPFPASANSRLPAWPGKRATPAPMSLTILKSSRPRADEVLEAEGPVFICVKTVPEVQNEPIGLRPPSRRQAHARGHQGPDDQPGSVGRPGRVIGVLHGRIRPEGQHHPGHAVP